MTFSLLQALLGLLLSVDPQVDSGCYVVANYLGTIGAYPVHLSLQSFEKGSDFGGGIRFLGSYYYDRKNTAIVLFGRRDEKGQVRLCEASDEAALDRASKLAGPKSSVKVEDCPFTLSVRPDGMSGQWSAKGKAYPVQLKQVAHLDNLEAHEVVGRFEVPFWQSAQGCALRGIYENTSTCGIELTHVLMIDQRSGNTTVEVELHEEECRQGTFMTPIYMNVDRLNLKGRSKSGDGFTVHSYGGKMGTNLRFKVKDGKATRLPEDDQ